MATHSRTLSSHYVCDCLEGRTGKRRSVRGSHKFRWEERRLSSENSVSENGEKDLEIEFRLLKSGENDADDPPRAAHLNRAIPKKPKSMQERGLRCSRFRRMMVTGRPIGAPRENRFTRSRMRSAIAGHTVHRGPLCREYHTVEFRFGCQILSELY